MLAQADHWSIDDIDEVATVKMWAHLPSIDGKASEKILVRIEGFLPSFRIELPYIVNNRPFNWTKENLKAYCTWFRATLGDDQPAEIEFKMMKKLYFCKARVDKEGKLVHSMYYVLTPRFYSLSAMRHGLSVLRKTNNVPKIGYLEIKVREDNVKQDHIFRTQKKIKYCDWVKFSGELLSGSNKISTCDKEYLVLSDSISPASEEEIKGLRCLPLFCSFDIETYSSNHNKFPNANYALDVLYQISMVFQTSLDSKSREKILLQLGEIDDIPGVTIYREPDEVSLIQRFCSIIQKKNPSVLIGYNILGFDISYMTSRLDLYLSKWPSLSLLKDQETSTRTLSWESSAYGANNYTLLDGIEGRVLIDLLPIVRKDITLKLDSYSLDTVSFHYLKKTKHPIKAKEMFAIYDLIQNAEKLVKSASSTEEKILSDERMRTARIEMARVGSYCVNDSCLPLDLADHLNTYVNLAEYSSVVSLSLTEVFTRGQMIRMFNQLYAACQEDNVFIDSRIIDVNKYKGGKVEKPIPGLYKYVSTFDFESLYPNIMREGNMCYMSLIPPESEIPDSMCHIYEIEADDEEKKILRRHRFLKAEHGVGLLPRILTRLLDERKRVKKMMTKELKQSDPFLYAICNAKQNALKVTANSIYGVTGASQGNIPLPELAESVTCQGRKKLDLAKKAVEELKYKVIYGDTDSVMIDTGAQSEKECADNGQRISDYLSKKTGLRMAYEECSLVFLPICPKKYLKLEFSGVPKMKGVMSARRDNCEWAREVYNDVCVMLLTSNPSIYDVIEFVMDECLKFLSRSFPISKIVTTKQMGSSYKLDSAPMKIFSDEMSKLGRPIEAGERVPFVYVQTDEKKVGQKMKTLDVFREGDYKLDLEHYIEKMLATHIDQLLGIVYKEEISVFATRYDQITDLYRDLGFKKKRGQPVTHVTEYYMFYWCRLLQMKRKVINSITPEIVQEFRSRAKSRRE